MSVKLSKASRALMRRSLRLLDMDYKPSEIAEELDTDTGHILRIVKAGAPARKDSKGRYWVHGESFAAWLKNAAPKNDKDLKKRSEVKDNEAYCLTCRMIIPFTEYRRNKSVLFGNCPKGHKVARFISSKNKKGSTKNGRN